MLFLKFSSIMIICTLLKMWGVWWFFCGVFFLFFGKIHIFFQCVHDFPLKTAHYNTLHVSVGSCS